MSIGIATMGKFRYQWHQNWLGPEGGSGGGVERKKPQVVVGEIKEDDVCITNKKIKILEVIEYDNI